MSKIDRGKSRVRRDAASYHQLLDDLPGEHVLSSVPTQLWLILSLEITVADEYGESLLLTYPSYSLDGNGPSDLVEGYWAPPFFGYPADLGFGAPDRVGRVKALFRDLEKSVRPQDAINELAYLMGLPSPEIEFVGEFIELKRSPRTPELWKCYKVKRYSCTKLGPRGLRNLADPECKKGFTFLPLRKLDQVLSKKYSSEHGREEHLFLSKPLMSNLDVVLSSSGNVMQLCARAIPVAPDNFRIHESGLLVCVDLAGYGTACKYAEENMRSFKEDGRQVAKYLRESVAGYFYQILAEVGIGQVHTAGDGFIATIPKRHFNSSSVSTVVKAFLGSYIKMLELIERLNSSIQEEDKKLGSRLALHYGDYRYGRIALTRSTSPDFDGDTIIKVARLEGALREYTKGPIGMSLLGDTTSDNISTGKVPADLKRHTLICSQEIYSAAGEFLDKEERLTQLETIQLKIKEFSATARIYSFRM